MLLSFYLCEITSNSGIHIYLPDLNKKIGGLANLAKKKARIGGFAYPYSPPSVSQSKLEATTLVTDAKRGKTIANTVTDGLGFTSDWMKKWRQFF